MHLVYFSGSANFGDELNRILWPHFAPQLFELADRVGFLGIGTIIGMPTPQCDFLHVFSSGVGYDRLDGWRVPHRIWCVRGPLTARMLGLDADAVMTDGAVLTPWAMRDAETGTGPKTVGVIPHWESLQCAGWREACDLAGFTLISPVGDPATVVRALRGSRLVITESLHGAIIADSYGIPWVPMLTSGNFSVFKWMDWCLSMQVPLTACMVPPPSLDALLRFGRPSGGAWGDCVTFSAADAIAEFDGRVGATPVGQAPPALRRRALRLLRGRLIRSGQARKLGGLAAGYRPARTAAHLVRAAQAGATLSRAQAAESLREQMAGRLHELCRVTLRDSAA